MAKYTLFIDIGQFQTKIALLPSDSYHFIIKTSLFSPIDFVYNTLKVTPNQVILILPVNNYSPKELQKQLIKINFYQYFQPLQHDLYFQHQNGILISFGEQHTTVQITRKSNQVQSLFRIFPYGERERVNQILSKLQKQNKRLQLNFLRKVIQKGVFVESFEFQGSNIQIDQEIVDLSRQFYEEVYNYVNRITFEGQTIFLVLSGFYAQQFKNIYESILNQYNITVTNGLKEAKNIIQ